MTRTRRISGLSMNEVANGLIIEAVKGDKVADTAVEDETEAKEA